MNFLKPIYHYLLALLGAIIYRFPSKKIFVLGVTGTKGKSTTIEIISSILESAGYGTAISSSVRFKFGNQSEENLIGNTMPGRFSIQKFLRRAVNSGCKYALIEVTSQGVLRSRHKFVDFDAAIFLNLHKEHIEAHGGFENYRKAKVGFFEYVSRISKKKFWNKGQEKKFFINIDDENSKYFKEVVSEESLCFFSGDIVSKNKYEFYEPKLLDFYKENMGAAITFARAENINEEFIKAGILKFRGVPGRMEIVQKEPFLVIIDYAHTPDSLEKVYKFLKEKFRPKKLICVLGSAGGGRDKWKRPKMGEIAGKYCNEIILTNEDPYNEEPWQIIDEIAWGCSRILNSKLKISNLYKIIDRKEAIQKAISLAKNDDVIIITGKGSESFIHGRNEMLIPWNEKKTVTNILRNKK